MSAVDALAQAYEHGWQPADVIHVTRRALDATVTLTAAALILEESRRSRAWSRAPRQWLDQLQAIVDAHPEAVASAAVDHAHARSLGFLWQYLSPWTALCPPPSAWPRQRSEPETQPSRPADLKVLNKIRGLLAKAESTEFTEEAETLTAKAQELMTRYAISSALLDAGEPGLGVTVHSRRVHLDNPYVKQKALLLTSIGHANHVRTLYNSRMATATMVGAPVDLEQVEMLFTSLLVQATRAMSKAGEDGSRSTSFRKAFLFGFAIRIGQRLTEADKAATARVVVDAEVRFGDLLPLLAGRAAAVKAEVDRLFGPTKSWQHSAVDPRGARAGREAADAATLSAGGRAIAG
ncbi:DUF2786 domain-containing protein [Rhodococcus maanshanensis]|uniref:DUF2786 domain-containing protein n=1 Tax=Rhodococcus maanshanensis TaxID=183556 RepID=A0A1H7Y1Z2_9NOCA|nr:DUF2786 domain-containing protein [Rhodococcus maanshanensis]SEM39925.1 Protein of unknown function [Rhodococcus maanshanensis]